MEDKPVAKQYKKIPLYSKEIEEYELNRDNIADDMLWNDI